MSVLLSVAMPNVVMSVETTPLVSNEFVVSSVEITPVVESKVIPMVE